MNDNCPAGSDLDPRAPWNEELDEEIELTVVSQISKTFTVTVKKKASKIDKIQALMRQYGDYYQDMIDEGWIIDDEEIIE